MCVCVYIYIYIYIYTYTQNTTTLMDYLQLPATIFRTRLCRLRHSRSFPLQKRTSTSVCMYACTQYICIYIIHIYTIYMYAYIYNSLHACLYTRNTSVRKCSLNVRIYMCIRSYTVCVCIFSCCSTYTQKRTLRHTCTSSRKILCTQCMHTL